MKTSFSLLIWFFLSAIAPAFAGADPESVSSVNDYFLGFTDGSYISLQNKPGYIKEIEEVCRKRGRIWALDVDATFTCTKAQYLEQGGDGPVIELQIKSDRRLKAPRHALLFSTKPFAEPLWKVRAITADEIAELQHTATLKRGKYQAAAKAQSLAKATVIEPFNGKLTIFLIPWRFSSDGIVDDKDFLIGLRSPDGQYTLSESRGTVVGYADLNGDGIPELQVSQKCDGACEYVTSVTVPAVSIGIFVH